MPDLSPVRRKTPSLDQTGRLAARALGVSKDTLLAGLRRVEVKDLPDVVALRARELGPQIRWDDAAYLRWRYHLAATQPRFQACELWQLRLGERLIGIVGHEHMQLAWRERTVPASRGMDVLIDREFDDSGLGVWLSQVKLHETGLCLAVGANENSIGMIERLYTPLTPRRSYVLPLNFRPLLKRVGVPAPAASLAGTGLNLLVPLRDWMKRPAPIEGLKLQDIQRFEAPLLAPLRAAQFQRATAGQRIEILRSAELLNWRLFDNPRGRYTVTGAFHNNGCVGYIAFRTLDGPRDSRVLHIIDWLTIGGEQEAALLNWRLLDSVIREAKRLGCASIQTVVRHSTSEALLKRLGFLVGRHAPYLIVGLHSPNADEMALADHADAWCITDLSFDSDGCF